MFVKHKKVRMHDTDAAQILYFAKQFRFTHDTFEEFMEENGIPLYNIVHGTADFTFAMVHAEADYLRPLVLGDQLEVQLSVKQAGRTSFSLYYEIYKEDDGSLAGTVTTVHVTLDRKTRVKIPLPKHLREILEKYTNETTKE
ncbi:MAG: 1,4-dihydroxy-2-naphthoyl-CoA hydrolase [Chlamydiales bacterium]|jgi:1,4-dihydroxy-2-naphthoyl-CoA hydrolase